MCHLLLARVDPTVDFHRKHGLVLLVLLCAIYCSIVYVRMIA